MSSILNIFGKKYEIIDTIEYITLADSFVKNKLGTGHGEAKLYVGNESQHLLDFFENFDSVDCFFCKKDFESFLIDAKSEYENPQQEYVRKDTMKETYRALQTKVSSFNNETLHFVLYRVPVAPPRVYVNSNSEFYDFMRSVGLPNISYLSVLKLKDDKNKIHLYFKIFIDYKSDIVGYKSPDEEQEEKVIDTKNISVRKKQTLIQARIGQGEYRNNLLDECPYCPFTMVNDERLLIASHIKPWAKSDDNEKIDPKNGFMFTPTYDKLFDKGFITFNADKTLIVSPWLSPMNQKRLNIYTGKLINQLPLDSKREIYLQYHREHIFKS